VRFRDVYVEHRLVDAFVPEPRLQPSRGHAEQRGVGFEGVSKRMEQATR
jgi:hypothetical protein